MLLSIRAFHMRIAEWDGNELCVRHPGDHADRLGAFVCDLEGGLLFGCAARGDAQGARECDEAEGASL